jgi:hypothetical protein
MLRTGRAAEMAEGVGPRVADKGRHESMKDRPMATLAVAAAVGFVLGAIWKTQVRGSACPYDRLGERVGVSATLSSLSPLDDISRLHA